MRKLLFFIFIVLTGLANGQSISSDYILKYSFEETSPLDSTGTYDAADESFTRSSTQTHDGTYSAYFDGANDYIETPSIALPSQFSFSVWVYVPSSTSNLRVILSNTTDGFSDDGFKFYTNEYLGTDQRVKMNTGNGSSGDNASTPDGALDFGTWEHIVFTYDSITDKGLIYVDNVKNMDDSSLTLDFEREAAIRIGLTTNDQYDYIGYIDDLRIFDWILSVGQVDSLYNGYENWIPDATTPTKTAYRTDRGDVAFIRNGINKVRVRSELIDDSFTGTILYIDGIGGNDDSTGLSETAAIKTFAKAQTILDNTFDYVVIANTTYYESFNISSIIKTYNDSLIITTWHKYGSGNAVIKGLSEITGWSQSGNYWTKTGLTGLPLEYNRFYQNKYFYTISCMNGLYINNTYYKVSKYPNTKTYYDIESGNGTTYVQDTDEGIASSGYWDDGIFVSANNVYVNGKFPISSYTSSGAYYLENGSWGDQQFSDYSGMKYFIMNHHNAADVNGEWTQNFSTNSIEVYYTGNLNGQDVYLPLRDTCFNITNSAYITIKGIDFYGANKAQVRVNSSLGINIDSCNFYRPPQGIAIYNSDTVSCRYNNIYYAADNGIVGFLNDHSTYSENYIVGAGVDATFGGGRDGQHMNGILSIYDNGPVIIEKNRIDSTGYCGILVSAAEDDDVSVLIKNNWVNDAMSVLCDGGAIYTFWNPYMSEKIIRGNLITNTYNNTDYHKQEIIQNGSIYIDEGYNDVNRNWLIDSNHLITNCTGLKANINTRRIIFRDNSISSTVLFVEGDGSETSHDIAYLRYGEYIDSSQWVKNDIVVGDQGSGRIAYIGGLNTWLSAYEYENLIDSNDYYDPFDISGDIWYTSTGDPDWVTAEEDLTWATGFFTDWEDNSTFNKTSWSFGNVTGISESQFVWHFYNWSDSSHEFDLNYTVFKDLEGNNVSGSLTLEPYTGKILFYVSGGVSGLPNPIYSE